MRIRAIVLLAFAAAVGPAAPAHGQAAPPLVYLVPIEGIIDLGLAPFVAARRSTRPPRAGAAAVVLEINTFGGRVDAAVQIRDALLDARRSAPSPSSTSAPSRRAR